LKLSRLISSEDTVNEQLAIDNANPYRLILTMRRDTGGGRAYPASRLRGPPVARCPGPPAVVRRAPRPSPDEGSPQDSREGRRGGSALPRRKRQPPGSQTSPPASAILWSFLVYLVFSLCLCCVVQGMASALVTPIVPEQRQHAATGQRSQGNGPACKRGELSLNFWRPEVHPAPGTDLQKAATPTLSSSPLTSRWSRRGPSPGLAWPRCPRV